MANLNEYDTSTTHNATVVDSQRITPNNAPEVRNIRLSIHRPDFNYREGQHIGIMVPGPFEFGIDRHFRLYTIANSPTNVDRDRIEIDLCVRRCFYIDEFSGEEFPGIASNYLCNLKKGDSVTFSGPYGSVFQTPSDTSSNLLMVGTGTGIAPFRAFIQHIYAEHPDWQGKVVLFYGARSGAENLYHNDQQNDLDKYYDQKTFQAFEGLSKRPWMSAEDDGLGEILNENADAIWKLVQDPKTHIYIAGLPRTRKNFEQVMIEVAGSKARWNWMKEEMLEQKRWSELVYS